MEKRLLIAIILSFVVIFLYQAVFMKKPPGLDSLPDAAMTAARPPDEAVIPEKPQEAVSAPQEKRETEEIQPTAADREELIHVDTSLYHAVWSNQGAVLVSWRLKQHKDTTGEDLELVNLSSRVGARRPLSLKTENPDFDQAINSALYKPSSLILNAEPGRDATLRFDYADESGTRVEKILIFHDGGYDFDIQINLWRDGGRIEPRLIWGPSIGNPSPADQKSRYGGGAGITVYSAGRVAHQEERKYKPERNAFNFVNWAAYDDQYFAALIFGDPQTSTAVFMQEFDEQIPQYYLGVNYVQKIYIGPKSYDILSDLGADAKRLVRFGFFGFIAEILYRAMKAIHKVVPNWGFCIILITILVKIVFFPLTYSSTKSMAKMQEIQPKIKALRAKYKKAKQDIEQRRKMNEEIMRLYKEHGVNPAGGCLPMLIQLPIFWGFFRLLLVAIEFRHAPFIFWIQDLSMKDPYYVTPILMGITQFISQKMTPSTGDSTQQRMMLIMPVVMTIFFMNFQSGLVLYWLTNNMLQIGQQYLINRISKKKKRESHGKRSKK
jgi:YidC/Oxa1 family membrane protein insertase